MTDYGQRIRTARAWADFTQDQLAEKLGHEKQWVVRREYTPDHDRYQEAKIGDRIAIAAVCGVPPEFLEIGFGRLKASEISQRLASLEELVQHLRRELVIREMEASQQTDEDDQTGEGAQ